MTNKFNTPSRLKKVTTVSKVLFCTICFICFGYNAKSQIINLPCQTEVDGFLGLDRKNWNGGSTAAHSEGSLHNFDFPNNTFGDCKLISEIEIELTVFNVDISNLNCTPPGAYYINIATGCPSLLPASCDVANLVDEPNSPNLNSQTLTYNSPPEDFPFGENLSIDIVPVMDVNCPNGQSAISSGEIILEYQICVTITVSDAVPEAIVNLGSDYSICPTTTTTIDAGTFNDYLWGPNGETTPMITVGDGTYTVTVTDNVGCTSTDEINILPFPDSGITFDPLMPNVCDNGQVSVSVNESYNMYNWSNALTGQTVLLSPGNYDVTITDGNNCTAVNSITVDNVPPPNAGENDATLVCNDGTTYDIDALLLAHDPGGNWTDDNGSGIDLNINSMTVDFSGISSGIYNYTYTVAGTAPCPADQATISVEVFEQNNAGSSAIEQYCSDPGNLDFNLLIGNPDLGGVWSDLDASSVDLGDPFAVDFNGVLPGTYNFQYLLTSNGPCPEVSETLTIIILESAYAGLDDETTVCEGTQFNLMDLVNGANDIGTFFDTDGSGELSGSIVNTTGLAGQTFNFTFIVGASGSPCGQDEAIFTLNIESNLSAGDDVTDSFCTDGDINLFDVLMNEDPGGNFTDINTSGGLAGNILTTTNIIPGTYSYQYTIGDGITCPQTSSLITLTFFEDPSINFPQIEANICEDVCEEIQINLSGLAPFNIPIEVYSATTGNLITSLDTMFNANVFTFTACNTLGNNEFVSDTLNLVSDSIWYVTVPTIIDVNCTIDNLIDADTLVINTISNSFFQLDTTACISDTIEIGGVMLFNGNATYQDTINGINCDSIIDISVTFMDIDTVMIDSTICLGDSIMIQGLWFSESTPNAEIDVFNPSGCDSLLVIEISFFPAIDTLLDLTLCTGDSIVVNGMVYDFSNPSGSEMLTAANGCDSIVDISLQFSNDIMLTINDTLCMDGFIEINGEIYDINNPTDQITISGSGCDTLINIDLSFHDVAEGVVSGLFCSDYSIEINGITYDFDNPIGNDTLIGASQYGCDSLVDINLQFYEPADTLISGPFCSDFFILLDGITYDINNPIGNDTLIGDSQFGCDSIVNFDLNFYPPSVFNLTEFICENDSMEINGIYYGANNIAGSDTIPGGSINGCDSIVNVQVSLLQTYNITQLDTICQGDSIFLEGNWQFVAGNYIDNLQTSDLCDSIITTQLTVNSCASNVFLTASNNICVMDSAGSISIAFSSNNTPPFNIIWEGQNSGIIDSQSIDMNQFMYTINNLFSDNYSITILDVSGTIIHQESILIIDDNTAIDGNWFVSDSIMCSGSLGSIEFQTNGGTSPYSYNWNPSNIGNSPSAQGITAGQYMLTVTDQAGCTFVTDFMFTEPEEFTATISSLQLTCLGSADGEISISNLTGGSLPYSISVNGENTDSMTFMNLDTGTYIIELLDGKNCPIEFIEVLTVESNSSLGAYTETYQIEEGDSVILEGSVVADNFIFEWIDPDGSLSCTDCPNPVATPSTSISYVLNIMDEQGCSESFNIEVEVTPRTLTNVRPNVFSPNGDNANDEFIFTYNDPQLIAMTMSIYDRWGSLVSVNLSTEDEVSWDGTKNGSVLEIGVYVYRTTIQLENGASKVIVGDILLID